jgi:hypothetical protein
MKAPAQPRLRWGALGLVVAAEAAVIFFGALSQRGERCATQRLLVAGIVLILFRHSG